MRREIEVYSHHGDTPQRAGVLRPSYTGRVLAGASFEYDPDFLVGGYALSPDLPLTPGRLFTPAHNTMFGALADAAPDEWGRKIIAASSNANPPRALNEFDYLLAVSDATRMGALRLRSSDGRWLSDDPGVANIHDLPRILDAAHRYDQHRASDEDLAYLNDIATSPGGARPKANVRLPSGSLAIAKLPHSKDGTIDVERWEAVALTLAASAGIRVPRFTVHNDRDRKAVLLLERFDRTAGQRIPYMSAFTALGLGTHHTGTELTYVDFADVIADISAHPRQELHEMFRRIALTVLISNADDHWRNHGFLRAEHGWQLSPVFDLNPTLSRTISSRRISHSADPGQRRLSDLIAAADAFELSGAAARTITDEIISVVATWPEVADRVGISPEEAAVMSRAFLATRTA
ncbi:type II toxin-antitoxin system HipA family toxin [Microbacterium sp.]|uniref:type II toxin-antitoxin system HipA family toxin n=1 Tax=Microbacterium sp. TaxID=51671 RepID=UPI0026361BD6|nr:type II toxin-antitoxin system HipA family toxin [Microbacterium sp.]